jgi:putative flavoprotein involved in K+ transport
MTTTNAPHPINGSATPTEEIDIVVIGAGQSGLSVGYHLKRNGQSFVILDANERIGDVWRNRWDSLRLFTPARFDALDGMPFPAGGNELPTKDQMADYLEAYAREFDLPVRTGSRVQRLSRDRDGVFRIALADGQIRARQVIVAMSSFQSPRVPSFASELDPAITQLHSLEYRNPEQLQPGGLLLVGAGNTGAELARELAADREVWLSGRDVGAIPFNVTGFLGRHILARLVLRGLFHRVLTMSTPMGRRMRDKVVAHSGPLIRTKRPHLAATGVHFVGRTEGTEDGKPRTEDGQVLDVANVIWCSGFHPGFSWIDLPIQDDGAPQPRHNRGVSEDEPGLYFVGLEFLSALSSEMIHGVGRDAKRIAGLAAAAVRQQAA